MSASHFAYRLRVAAHRLGWVGGLGLALLVAAALFYFSAVRPAQGNLAALQDRLDRAEIRGRAEGLRSSVEPSRMEEFLEFFPPLETAPRWLKTVYSIADRERLELLTGTYRISEDPLLMLAHYTISLPVRGSYPQIRRFIAASLNEVPIASLEGVVFQRDKVSEGAVEANVMFTLHLRAAPRASRPGQREQVARSDAPPRRTP
ncbi:MAG: hypothetical protein WBO23_05920 [Burkholderiales bacterium]